MSLKACGRLVKWNRTTIKLVCPLKKPYYICINQMVKLPSLNGTR